MQPGSTSDGSNPGSARPYRIEIEDDQLQLEGAEVVDATLDRPDQATPIQAGPQGRRAHSDAHHPDHETQISITAGSLASSGAASAPATGSSDGASDVRSMDNQLDGASSAPESEAQQDPPAQSSRQNQPSTRRGTRGTGNRTGYESRTPQESGLTAGDQFEYRLARMYFWQGSFARAGVDLQRHFDPEPLLVTDLDLLAYHVTPQLDLVKTIGEAKSGTGRSAPKPLDRAIWLAGLKKLVGADRAQLLTAVRPSSRVRETAKTLGVHAIHIDELTRWEASWLDADLVDAGSHGPAAFREVELVRRRVKGQPELERAFWFLRSEVWFLDPWQASKRIIGLLGLLTPQWTPGLDDDIAAALRWLYAEALSVLTLQLVALTGRYMESDESSWPTVVKERLSEGAVPTHNMRSLADSFDQYLGSVMAQTNASNQLKLESLGAFHPTPPDWAETLIDLIGRLSASPVIAELPRYLDLVLHERLVKRRHVSTMALERVTRADDASFARDRRLVNAFLRGAVELPDVVSRALTT